MLTLWAVFSIVFILIVGFVIFLTTPKKKDVQSNYFFAAPRTPNDYSNLYRPGGAPVQAPPPVQNVPAPSPQEAAPPPVQPQTPPPVRQQFQTPPPKPPVPKKPFSPIPLLLIAGVLFLFLGGIIFLTSTWDTLPDIARAISLLSASVIAFTFNVIAERGLKLPKTGLAFYILGCIFLPLALGGIGAFSLFGEWFSFKGDGGELLMALIFLCVAATSFLGQSNYKSPFLAWLGLTGIAGMWTSLQLFLITMAENGELLSVNAVTVLTAILQTLLSVGASVASELSLRKHAYGTTPLSKAWMPFLFPLHCFNLIFLLVCAMDVPLVGSLCMLVIALLFLNERFITGPLHLGIPGFALGLITSLTMLVNTNTLDSVSGFFSKFIFVCAVSVFVMLTIASLPKLRVQTRKTMGIMGLVLCYIPTLPAAFFGMCIGMENFGTHMLFLFFPLLMAGIHFAATPRNPLSSHSIPLALYTVLLYCIALEASENPENLLFRLLLVIAALILVVQFLLSRRLWPLMLSVCSCVSVALLALPYAAIWLHWLCTAALLVCLIYAITARRPLLERTGSWVLIPFLLTSCCMTFSLILDAVQAEILTFAVLALVYIAEYTILRTQLHAAPLRSYCLNLSVLLSFGTFLSVTDIPEEELLPLFGWLLLCLLSLLVMTAGHLRRNINITAMPMLLLLFSVYQSIVGMLEFVPSLSGNWCLTLQIICYVLIIVLFAGMGRLLLPDGFCRREMGVFQLDWGIIAAVLPILSVSSAIDWYPSILSCLMLTVYSVLFIGRVKNRCIPMLLASAFGCLTLFFHNIHDPFGLLAWWHNADFSAPQILLYLLPMHLFILSLLWILPKHFRNAVHTARFCMYCFTMFCLLVASLNFGKAMDGIILAVFSFLILLGSFGVKRLRWFTLGFSVLTLMTVKLTWEFWQSLHWGVYLFLAGAALIGIAFYFEFKVRKNSEKASLPQEEQPAGSTKAPIEPKEKINLFKEWSW